MSRRRVDRESLRGDCSMPMSGLVGRPLGRTAFEATLAAAVVALCGAFAQETRADTLTLAADYDNYTMGTSQSGNSGGGEFAVTQIQNLVTFQGSAGRIQ